MATQIPVGATKAFKATFTDEDGAPTNVDPTVPPNVTTAQGKAEIVSATISDDGFSCTGQIKVTGVGADQLSVKVDPARDPSVTRELILLGDFEGIAKEAVAGTVEFSDPTP